MVTLMGSRVRWSSAATPMWYRVSARTLSQQETCLMLMVNPAMNDRCRSARDEWLELDEQMAYVRGLWSV